MASRSLHELFLRARDQFAGSGRWSYLAVLVLAMVHAGVVTPFIESALSESRTSSERKRLAGAENGLGGLHDALQATRDETSATLAPVLKRLVDDLEHDLARLDATRRRHAAKDEDAGPDNAESEEDEEGDEIPAAGGEAEEGPPPFQLDDPDRIADLRDAESRDDMLAALAPLAEELIAQPRWFDVEQSWRSGALPRLQARLDAAAGDVPRLRGQFPEARAQWEALAGALTALTRGARELRLEPPAAPFWWTLPTAGEAVELGLTAEAADDIRRPRELAALEATADLALERFTAVAGELRKAIRELGEPPSTGFLLGLDLATLVPMFPLFLGLGLGGAMLWRSGRLRELGLTARMAIEHGSPPALRRWLWGHVQWSTSAGRSAARAWRASVLQTLLGYFLAMGWITFAAVQLRQLETLDRHRLMAFAVAGAAAVLVAVVHRLAVARQAIGTLDLDDEGDEEEDEEGEGEVIETVDEIDRIDNGAAGAPEGSEIEPDELPLRR